MNGIQLQTDDSDIFSFYNVLTKESRFIDNLTDIFIDYGSTTMNKELIGALLSTPLNMYVIFRPLSFFLSFFTYFEPNPKELT